MSQTMAPNKLSQVLFTKILSIRLFDVSVILVGLLMRGSNEYDTKVSRNSLTRLQLSTLLSLC